MTRRWRHHLTEGMVIVCVTVITGLIIWALSGCTANIYLGGTHQHGPATTQPNEPTWTFGIP